MGKRAGVPVLVDLASDLPPWGQPERFLRAGADLGRRNLIDAARLNSTPNDNIGRGMKVGKEEIVGLVAALEQYVKRDHAAEMRQWNARAQRIVDGLQGIRGLDAPLALNTAGYADADLTWDERQIALNRDSLHAALAKGSPQVELEVIVGARVAG